MSEGWRWEGVVSLTCAALLPAWMYFATMHLQTDYLVVLSIVLGLGMGCGIAGVRRGRLANRLISTASLVLLLIAAVALVVLLWLTPSWFI